MKSIFFLFFITALTSCSSSPTATSNSNSIPNGDGTGFNGLWTDSLKAHDGYLDTLITPDGGFADIISLDLRKAHIAKSSVYWAKDADSVWGRITIIKYHSTDPNFDPNPSAIKNGIVTGYYGYDPIKLSNYISIGWYSDTLKSPPINYHYSGSFEGFVDDTHWAMSTHGNGLVFTKQ